MSFIAILGAGPLGSAVAHRLAERAVVREIRWIDDNADVAAGKALDIQQAGSIARFDTRVVATSDERAAVGAHAIVIADAASNGEWRGADGLALVRRLATAGADGPFVFAGPAAAWLMEASARELKVPRDRLIGTAAAAIIGAVQATTAAELDLSPIDVSVVGRPPAFAIVWSSATAGGTLVTDRIPAHRLLVISNAVPRLWPPRSQAIGAATAKIVTALVDGSRRRHQAMTVVDGDLGARGTAVLLPLRLGLGRVLAYELPSLSPQERTELMNQMEGHGTR